MRRATSGSDSESSDDSDLEISPHVSFSARYPGYGEKAGGPSPGVHGKWLDDDTVHFHAKGSPDDSSHATPQRRRRFRGSYPPTNRAPSGAGAGAANTPTMGSSAIRAWLENNPDGTFEQFREHSDARRDHPMFVNMDRDEFLATKAALPIRVHEKGPGAGDAWKGLEGTRFEREALRREDESWVKDMGDAGRQPVSHQEQTFKAAFDKQSQAMRGFICPICMSDLGTQTALEPHYKQHLAAAAAAEEAAAEKASMESKAQDRPWQQSNYGHLRGQQEYSL